MVEHWAAMLAVGTVDPSDARTVAARVAWLVGATVVLWAEKLADETAGR